MLKEFSISNYQNLHCNLSEAHFFAILWFLIGHFGKHTNCYCCFSLTFYFLRTPIICLKFPTSALYLLSFNKIAQNWQRHLFYSSNGQTADCLSSPPAPRGTWRRTSPLYPLRSLSEQTLSWATHLEEKCENPYLAAKTYLWTLGLESRAGD